MDRETYLQRLEMGFRAYKDAVIKFRREDTTSDAEVNEARHAFLLILGLEDVVLDRKDVTPLLQSLRMPDGDRDHEGIKPYNPYDPSRVMVP